MSTPAIGRTAGVFSLILFGAAVCSGHSRWIAGSLEASPEQRFQTMKEDTSGLFNETESLISKSLDIGAWNEYGQFDQHALALYGLDMVVEPFRETQLRVLQSPTAKATFHPSTQYHWLLIPIDKVGAPIEGAEPIVEAKGGIVATINLTMPGAQFALLVERLGTDGRVVAEGKATITCKYVRRELRDMTEADRTAFFEAMKMFYTISIEEGEAKYGQNFYNYAQVAAYHNSQRFCYHNGMQFLTAHAAFNVVVERSLQMINPSVTLAIWDFMIESGTLGKHWPLSEVFGPSMFGSAFGEAENSFQISDGWFANISSIYDPNHDTFGQWIDTNHNPYGYVSATFDFQDLPGITRTHSYCGMKGEAWFAQCDVYIACFETEKTLYDWAACMEIEVHATMHGMIGGGFNCNINMEQFIQDHPEYSRSLLTFALEFILANKWPHNALMHDYNTCDDSCQRGDPCGCTCEIDPFDMSDDEVYDFMSSVMEALSGRFVGDRFIDEDSGERYPYGFMQAGERLSEEKTFLLLRVMMMIGCEPGAIGAMSGGASPSDPIFWVVHPIFEKGFHILALSSSYRDKYDSTWVNGTCRGSKLYDEVPFTGKMLGFDDTEELLTNAELLELLNPANGRLSYLYESFQKCGSCRDWDPCPDCRLRKDA